uniref:Uncharacterized protein n=1 Tax=Arundo donax TaxID=35708 RepID=A0A0A8YDG5_ARUDO
MIEEMQYRSECSRFQLVCDGDVLTDKRRTE